MEIISAAIDVRQRAYAPYSGYFVGAALEDEEHRIHVGTNVENVSYAATICAERSAISSMISAGGRQILRVAVATKDGGFPCGICLQTILEFAQNPQAVEIVTVNETGQVKIFQLSQLIPLGFDSSEVHRTV